MFEQLEVISKDYHNLEKLLVVKIDTQELIFFEKGTIIKRYIISSSAYGTGS